jgi:dihydrofolate reductase
MRKVIMFNLITLDGYFEGPGNDISWHQVDDEFNEFAIEQLSSTDGLIFGRVTYQLMANF